MGSCCPRRSSSGSADRDAAGGVTCGSCRPTYGSADAFPADGSGPQVTGWGRYGQAVAAELAALGLPAAGFEATLTPTCPPGADCRRRLHSRWPWGSRCAPSRGGARAGRAGARVPAGGAAGGRRAVRHPRPGRVRCSAGKARRCCSTARPSSIGRPPAARRRTPARRTRASSGAWRRRRYGERRARARAGARIGRRRAARPTSPSPTWSSSTACRCGVPARGQARTSGCSGSRRRSPRATSLRPGCCSSRATRVCATTTRCRFRSWTSSSSSPSTQGPTAPASTAAGSAAPCSRWSTSLPRRPPVPPSSPPIAAAPA